MAMEIKISPAAAGWVVSIPDTQVVALIAKLLDQQTVSNVERDIFDSSIVAGKMRQYGMRLASEWEKSGRVEEEKTREVVEALVAWLAGERL